MNPLELKAALRNRQVVLGTWVFEFNTSGIPRLLASTGIDFAIYDMEHSGFGMDSIRNMVSLSRSLNLAALVRPPAAKYHLIAPLLDAGASGIIAPMVQTAEQAAEVAEACRYPPQGRRGAAFSISHDDFLPGSVIEKIDAANQSVLCALLIETERAVSNLEKILEVPGIDLIWIGHFDLSLTMGIAGQFEHPRFLSAIDFILKECAARQIPTGILVNDPQQAAQRIQQGFRCLSYWGDIWLLQKALREGVQEVRSALLRR